MKPRILVHCVLAGLLLAVAPGATRETDAGQEVVRQLLDVQRRAADRSLPARSIDATIERARFQELAASARSQPSFSWHGEGFGGSFERAVPCQCRSRRQ